MGKDTGFAEATGLAHHNRRGTEIGYLNQELLILTPELSDDQLFLKLLIYTNDFEIC